MNKTGLLPRWIPLVSIVLALGLCAGIADAAYAVGFGTRSSVAPSGDQGNGRSYASSVSGDGRYVAFTSDATNFSDSDANGRIVRGDTNGVADVFVHDRLTGTTARVSVSSAGVQGNGASGAPRISSDGRYVVFESTASNLVAGDTNAQSDVFVRDRVTGATTRASVTTSGAQANGSSIRPSISGDGRVVAFESAASNLVAGDTNGNMDIFVRDRVAGSTKRVSVDSSGAQAVGYSGSGGASVSSDGRHVAFHSDASNLVAGDTNGHEGVDVGSDVFVHDLATGVTTRVSVSSSGAQSGQPSFFPSMSSDGRYVAFVAEGSLDASDTDMGYDVYVHDCTTGATVLRGECADDGQLPAIALSGNGRYVAYSTERWRDAGYYATDTYVTDCVTGVTTVVSVDPSGAEGDGGSFANSISGDGRYVAFESWATNFAPGDTNGTGDVYVMDTLATEPPPSTTWITIATSATSASIGKTVTLWGAVTPLTAVGHNIVVYVKKPGSARWTYSSNRTVYLLGRAAWQYKYYFKPGMAKGTYTFKAVVPAWTGFVTSTSATTVSIRLR